MKTILIIEDDMMIAKALSIRIKFAGYKASMAHDAATGVIMARKIEPDLVLLDINLPAGNGFLVAERIWTQLPMIVPIIFLTASKDPDFLQKAKDMGAAGYFEKPYEADELIGAITEILEG